ncbi:putative aspartyl protease [Quercus suber]|uniref:Aspartyl protease n=1 Tax=Quercus suber TaxID=58331 RepID=A0AAW0LF76_QUESU
MAAHLITIATFLLFILLTASMFNFNQTLAKERNHNSMVLGMAQYSRSSLPPIPRASRIRNSSKKPSKILDMMEPLREITNGYLLPLNLGSPPQVIQVYMDTGSDLTWVPCGNISFDCMECDEYRNNKLTTAAFSPSFSSSSSRDLCGSSFCNDIHSSDSDYDTCTMAGCSLATLLKSTCPRPCPLFAYTYGDGGVVTGALTRDTLMSAITYPRAKDVEMRSGFDLCYKVPCKNNNTFIDDLPLITFHFLNNVSLALPQGNHFYAMGAPSESTVVKCLLFQSMDNEDDNIYGPAGVFGSFQQQNVEVVYDLEQERVGFQPRDCAVAAAAQGQHKM